MALQQSDEIKAAKQRLVAATEWEDSTTRNLEMVTKMLESMQKDNENAKNEKAEADLYLKRIEKRFKVIDVDEPIPDGRSSRKVNKTRAARAAAIDNAISNEPQKEQQIRASSRKPAIRTYNELNSDDDELCELMSTHTKPSGKHVEDWTVLNHFFKMPRGSQVNRKWLTRSKYQRHCLGKQLYCPQVGDSVVYIPRAHDEFMHTFPIGGYSAPWKSWGTQSSWPVVRCKITHIRYRFPYEIYFGSRRPHEILWSCAAILTLEINGVPSHSERSYPWPSPTFVSTRTRGYDFKFDVTLFETHLVDDFIIPEYLYTWRVQALERAICANDENVDGIDGIVHFHDDDRGITTDDDEQKKPFKCNLIAINESDEEEFHFHESGFNALSMEFEEEVENCHNVCAWDVTVNDASTDFPAVPAMGSELTTAVMDAMNQVLKLDGNIKEWFYNPVDTRKYTDYLDMIEVPMYLSFIKKRLRNNYYTNKVSVVADMELVKENCYKYNEDNNDMYALACRMYDEFKSLVDSIEDPPTLETVKIQATRAQKKRNVSSKEAGQSSAEENLSHSDTSGMGGTRNIRSHGTVGTKSRVQYREASDNADKPGEGMSDAEITTLCKPRGQSCRKSDHRKPNYSEKGSDEEEHSSHSTANEINKSDNHVVHKNKKSKR